MATVLNSLMSGLVRYGKFAALGLGVATLTGESYKDPTANQTQVDKYIAQLGLIPDARDLVLDAYKAGQEGNASRIISQVPVLGLMEDYKKLATGEQQVDAAFGLMPLGNTLMGDMLKASIEDQFNKVRLDEDASIDKLVADELTPEEQKISALLDAGYTVEQITNKISSLVGDSEGTSFSEPERGRLGRVVQETVRKRQEK